MAKVSTEDSRYERGLELRREVLGADHVARSMEKATPFTEPVQKLVTEYCWGEIWSRPGLDRRARSIANLSMITALNRNHELGLHVRGALNNGLSREEIKEVLLQTAIYCGVPASLESFRVAERVLAEIDAEG